MGHYRSEMVSDEEDARERAFQEEKLQRRVDRLKERIEEHGLEKALIMTFEVKPGELGW